MSNLGNRSKGAGTDARQNKRKSSEANTDLVEDVIATLEPPDLDRMKKPELIEYATSLGVPTSNMTVREIKEALGE